MEASETLVFTPETLKSIDGAPGFTLRAVTSREKRFRMRMHREAGILSHSAETVKAETLNGLRALWSEEQFTKYIPWVTEYWEALENFELVRKDDPEIVFEYDKEVEAKVLELIDHVERNWPALARMNADISEYQEVQPMFYAAVTVKSWTGLDVRPDIDRGYLTLDCVEALRTALFRFEERHKTDHKLTPGLAWFELYAACLGRHVLGEDERKNSESPSPLPTTPVPSTTTTGRVAGKSPASARSRKTPKTS